jgi:hypothetical protein
VRTPTATTAPTPPPLPTLTATRTPTQPLASPTSTGLQFRLKEKRFEEKLGQASIEVLVLDKNGQGITGIRVRIDGGDPNTWKWEVTTDDQGRCGHYALSPGTYNVTLLDYGVIEPGIDCKGKYWEVIFVEAY